jgi:FkbM family methyltransferase
MEPLFDTSKHSDLVYDVGMHKGEDSWFYLQKGFRVIGFEADPVLAQYCRDRFQPFIAAKRLIVVEGAITDQSSDEAGSGKVRFYRNNDVSVWGTAVTGWAERNVELGASSELIEVDRIDIGSVIRQHGIPHYMKIDIEGLDIACVASLKRFRERPDYLSIESDKTSMENIRRELDLLEALGYDAFQAVEQSRIPQLQTPSFPSKEGRYVAHRFEHGCSGLFGAELPGEWKSKREIVRQYRLIQLGYYLVGDRGILNSLRVLRALAVRFLGWFTKSAVPGWFDTHARHSSVAAGVKSSVGSA